MALSTSPKLAVICIINTKVLPRSKSYLGFDLTYFSFFIINFVHLEFAFLQCMF